MWIPWKIQNALTRAEMVRNFIGSKLRHKGKTSGLNIHIVCGFQGQAGGPEAIASIANVLSDRHNFYVEASPTSYMNRWLLAGVDRGKAKLDPPDLYICDRGIKHEDMVRLKRADVPIIASIHGLPTQSHGLGGEEGFRVFDYANTVHFVSDVQAREFQALGFGLDCKIIANASDNLFLPDEVGLEPVGRVGMVGYFTRPQKNLLGNLKVASASNASEILVWGPTDISDVSANVKLMGFNPNQREVFNSFDVFVSLSETETFGLSVVQAMSAGKECVLSDIPAHRAYADCPGVTLVDVKDHKTAISALNTALGRKGKSRDAVHAFWKTRYSREAVSEQWMDWLATLIPD